MRHLWISAAGVVVAGTVPLGAAGATAQEASPPAGLEFPDPAECTVDPRSVDELRVLIQEAATPVAEASAAPRPTPAVLASGEPADEQTVAEWAPFLPLTDVGVLTDGRVAAVGLGESGQGEVLIFVREGDRWQIDDQVDLQPAATPAS